MEFWGVEVKPGQTVYCDADEERVVHISQVALGETEKESVKILVSAKIGDQKVVIGTLSPENHPQILCDLIFEKKFELSHSSKTASVFACGYKVHIPRCESDSSESDSDSRESDSSEDEDEVETVNNRMINPIVDHVVKPPTTKDDKKVTDNPLSGEDDSDFSSDSDDYTDDESSSSDDDTDSEEDGTRSVEMDTSSEEDAGDEEVKDAPKAEDGMKTVSETALKTPASEDTSNKEDTSDEEDKNTPKPEVAKKRAAETELKTPASDKKAKIETPSGQDTDDKKVAHEATPHPAKQASKEPGNSKPDRKSKYVGGAHACKSCSRTFGSASALQSHEKAKHA